MDVEGLPADLEYYRPAVGRPFRSKARYLLSPGHHVIAHKALQSMLRGAMEHRYGRRYSVRTPVYLETPDAVIAAGWLTEVSLSGASVITHRPVEVDVCLRVRILGGPGGSIQSGFSIAAHVTRPTQYGCALEWDELMPELLSRMNLQTPGDALANIENARHPRTSRHVAR